MAQVFDLLDIDLVRIANHQFEGTGSIPIPEDGDEVWEVGPQRPFPNLAGPFRLEFGLEVNIGIVPAGSE